MISINKLALAGAMAAAVSVAAVAAPASAEVFAGSYNVSVQSSDPGLVLHWAPIAPGLNFNLPTAGSSTSFPLFQLWTDEGSIESDDRVAKPIQVNLAFTLPSVFGGQVNGQTVGESILFGLIQDGRVTWSNNGDALMNFAGGGQLLAHLDNAVFNKGFFGLDEGPGDGAAIGSTFTLVKSAVPEPATWGMMILGLGMVGMGLRLRRRETVKVLA
ncbi:MAG: sorting protein [Caulobacteraceae bacterium]|nr:sorting protein [Caulobacteraceae bacterium]